MIFYAAFLVVIPFILGYLVTQIYGDNEKGSIYRYLMGMCSLICVFEVIAVVAMKVGMSFSKTMVSYMSIIGLVCVLGVIYLRKNLKNLLKEMVINLRQLKFNWRIIPVLLIFFLQCLNFFIINPFIGDDVTKEIVNTTIATNTMYLYHPLTGKLLEVGMTPIGKLVTLPLFYSTLASFFKLNVTTLLYLALPVGTLIMGYLVMLLWVRFLFPKEQQKNIQFYALMVYGVLNLFGDYYNSTEFYWVSHSGWRGETITIAVIFPFILYILINKSAGKKRYLAVLIALLTTICLANLSEGFLFCFIEILIYFLVKLLVKIWEVYQCRT